MNLKREIKELTLLIEEKLKEIGEIETKIRFRRKQQEHIEQMSKIEDRLVVIETIKSKHSVQEFLKNQPQDITKEGLEVPTVEKVTKIIERKGLRVKCTLTFHKFNITVSATARCHYSDKFDLQKGIELAEARANLKFYQQYVENLIK